MDGNILSEKEIARSSEIGRKAYGNYMTQLWYTVFFKLERTQLEMLISAIAIQEKSQKECSLNVFYILQWQNGKKKQDKQIHSNTVQLSSRYALSQDVQLFYGMKILAYFNYKWFPDKVRLLKSVLDFFRFILQQSPFKLETNSCISLHW